MAGTDRHAAGNPAMRGLEAFRPVDLACQPILVGASAAEQGCLVLAEGRLVAVLVRIGGEAPSETAGWFLEAGFGRCFPGASQPLFETLAEALAWVRRRLAQDTAGTPEALRAAFGYARWLHLDTERLLAKARSALAAADRLLEEAAGAPGAAREPYLPGQAAHP